MGRSTTAPRSIPDPSKSLWRCGLARILKMDAAGASILRDTSTGLLTFAIVQSSLSPHGSWEPGKHHDPTPKLLRYAVVWRIVGATARLARPQGALTGPGLHPPVSHFRHRRCFKG